MITNMKILNKLTRIKLSKNPKKTVSIDSYSGINWRHNKPFHDRTTKQFFGLLKIHYQYCI
ncbi:hypothetical protein B9Z42_08235 [Limnohabitans sp. B9-3]|nr:hypothetical protein B9Z42_08235 [Limnohabitans sp. B9-3]